MRVRLAPVCRNLRTCADHVAMLGGSPTGSSVSEQEAAPENVASTTASRARHDDGFGNTSRSPDRRCYGDEAALRGVTTRWVDRFEHRHANGM